MKLGFASDHRGFTLKNKLIEFLKNDYEIVDCGTYSEESCDYPDYAKVLGEKIVNKEVDYGIAICGSGIGISIACNKIKGVYCAKVNNPLEAEYTRLDNNTNCVAFTAETDFEEAKKIVLKFINTEFSNEERHIRRINKVKEIEENNG